MKLNRFALIGVAAVVVVLALSALVFSPSILPGLQTQTLTNYSSGAGTLNIFLADAPPSSTSLKYLLINVTSVVLKYEGNVSTAPPRDSFVFQVPKSNGMNVDLTSLGGNGVLLGATKVPAGNVTDMILNITGAKGFFTDGTSAQLKVVADGKLMMHYRFQVSANGSTDLKIDLQPNDIHISAGNADVLTPVIRVSSVERSQSGTMTRSTTVTASTTTSK